MKVCPVCQYEEEDTNEVSCAICGSDLESESSSAEEPAVEESPKEAPSLEEKQDNIENSEESEVLASDDNEISEMTAEEKEIEEALAGTETSSSDDLKSGIDFNKYFSLNICW